MDGEEKALWAGWLAGGAVVAAGALFAERARAMRLPPELAVRLAKRWGGVFGVEPMTVLTIMAVETDFDPSHVNRSERAAKVGNAWGLMQLLPGTAQDLAKLLVVGRGTEAGTPQRAAVNETLKAYKADDPSSLLDANLNAMLGAYYLARLTAEFQEFDLVAAAYQQGPGKVRELLRKGLPVVPNLGPHGQEYVALALNKRARLVEKGALT